MIAPTPGRGRAGSPGGRLVSAPAGTPPRRGAGRRVDAAEATALALLNCAVREICAPGGQVWPDPPYLIARLPHVGVTLRARLARPPVAVPRLAGPIEELRGGWVDVGWRRLTDLVGGELELMTGAANPEFAAQVAAGHEAMALMARVRAERTRPPAGADPGGAGTPAAAGRFLESEQSLVAGHRYHPAPKARQGAEWARYAPETRSRFPLRWLAVREDAVAEEGDVSALDRLGPPVRAGYRVLPAHPWQLALLRPEHDAIVDLGPYGPAAVPTSSVRTVYLPDVFLKFSLGVRITNCVRKNAWYELSGAVALTRALRPVFDGLPCDLLGEPGYRSVAVGGTRLREGLGVIVRDGVRGLPGTPLLAAAIADPYGDGDATVAALLGDASPERALAWWDAYVGHVAPPVLRAYLDHGVVLEPHLQNVLVAVDGDGMPVRAAFRDLEGTKLLPGPWASFLAELPEPVARAMTYDPERGWNRVVYCLFVNHLAEVAAAVADLYPSLERELWRVVRRHVARCGAAPAPSGRANPAPGGRGATTPAEHAAATPGESGRVRAPGGRGGWAPAGLAVPGDHGEARTPDGRGEAVPGGRARLRALLAGVPLPAKANLLTRWRRAPDRAAAYIPVPNPFAGLDDPGGDDLGNEAVVATGDADRHAPAATVPAPRAADGDRTRWACPPGAFSAHLIGPFTGPFNDRVRGEDGGRRGPASPAGGASDATDGG